MLSRSNRKFQKVHTKQSFAIKKFTVGVASVLVGTAFVGLSNQASANSVPNSNQVETGAGYEAANLLYNPLTFKGNQSKTQADNHSQLEPQHYDGTVDNHSQLEGRPFQGQPDNHSQLEPQHYDGTVDNHSQLEGRPFQGQPDNRSQVEARPMSPADNHSQLQPDTAQESLSASNAADVAKLGKVKGQATGENHSQLQPDTAQESLSASNAADVANLGAVKGQATGENHSQLEPSKAQLEADRAKAKENASTNGLTPTQKLKVKTDLENKTNGKVVKVDKNGVATVKLANGTVKQVPAPAKAAAKKLPQTGESNSNNVAILGLSAVAAASILGLGVKRKER